MPDVLEILAHARNRRIAHVVLSLVWLGSAMGVRAQEWQQTSAPSNDWASVACSADGKTLLAIAGAPRGGFFARSSSLFISTNSGNTWLSASPTNFWTTVACSADASHIFALTATSVFTSPDFGQTWISNNLPKLSWQSIACSADANKAYLVAGTGQFFSTTNFGALWISNTAPFASRALCCSADGVNVVSAGNRANSVCTSTNLGATWVTNQSPAVLPTAVASSANAQLLAVSDSGSKVLTSLDFGVTLGSDPVPSYTWNWIASSASGTNLVVVGSFSSGEEVGPVYTSTDAGLSWSSNNVAPQAWVSVACSADGNLRIAATPVSSRTSPVGTGSIWISRVTATPSLNIDLVDTNVLVSWMVPSSDFILQQTSDLAVGEWQDVSTVPTLNLATLQNEVLLPLTSTNAFFRLRSN